MSAVHDEASGADEAEQAADAAVAPETVPGGRTRPAEPGDGRAGAEPSTGSRVVSGEPDAGTSAGDSPIGGAPVGDELPAAEPAGGEAAVDEISAAEPGAEPGADTDDAEPGTPEPGTAGPRAAGPRAAEPGSAESDDAGLDTAEPGAAEPDDAGTGTAAPDDADSTADESATGEPSADERSGTDAIDTPPAGADGPAADPAELAPGTGQAEDGRPAGSEPEDDAPARSDAAVAVSRTPPDLTEDDALDSALEALLLVVDVPAGEELLADVLDQPVARIRTALQRLASGYEEAGRGIDLRRVGEGWRFYTRETYAPYVERYLLDGQRAKLTRAALETLAVISYRQPVTRARVAAVRGVNVDGVIRTLVGRGLVEEAGTDPETGGFLYCTTELFLERLGLSSLKDLPPLAPLLPEVDTIDDV
ncbi:SMC-Scp complex subunit ScpB [Saccharopolyspora gregorii]|uniref:Segregation and condensation protein B n=1 Tax=Saccharopolyspora gregorii TaxID=33914 RepID=A0ABP6RSB4_9PSEU